MGETKLPMSRQAEVDDDIDWKGKRITNMGAPINPDDACTKGYADGLGGGGSPKQYVSINVHKSTVACAVANGEVAWTCPIDLDGYQLEEAIASVHDPGEGGISMQIQIRRRRDGTDQSLLDSPLEVMEMMQYGTDLMLAADVGLQTGDQIYFDIIQIHDILPANGLSITMTIMP